MASTRIFVLPGLLLMLALPLAGEARSLDAPKAPPTEPVYEVDPGERVGYTRVMGHWEWTGDNYMWSPGQWIAEKEGSVWVGDSWAQRGKKWHLTPGHYEADGSAAETTDTAPELHTERPDAAAEQAKEHADDSARGNAMDEVEQKVLTASRKPVDSSKASKSGTHKMKHPASKKQPNYKDPKQYPFYHRH